MAMKDPHVVSLRYTVKYDPRVKFENPPPLEHETESFTLRLAGETLMVEMKDHHAAPDSARALVEPFLEAWGIDTSLNTGWTPTTFNYQTAKIVDHAPPEPVVPGVIHAEGAEVGQPGSEAGTFTVSQPVAREYPKPPESFALDPTVASMFDRYRGYRAGREPLFAMAYWCLTCLERAGGGRERASDKYGIDLAILRTLGQITSTAGDPMTARKVNDPKKVKDSKFANSPLTPQLRTWVDNAVKLLIRRAGQYAADPAVAKHRLTLKDLPPPT